MTTYSYIFLWICVYMYIYVYLDTYPQIYEDFSQDYSREEGNCLSYYLEECLLFSLSLLPIDNDALRDCLPDCHTSVSFLILVIAVSPLLSSLCCTKNAFLCYWGGWMNRWPWRLPVHLQSSKTTPNQWRWKVKWQHCCVTKVHLKYLMLSQAISSVFNGYESDLEK